MKTKERRKNIIAFLLAQTEAVTGSELSKMFGVSRQIIVGDIDVLRKAGNDIASTHNGYIVRRSPYPERVLKVYHTAENTENELNTIVELGGTVIDVFVNHEVYGKISVPLNFYSKEQISQFMDGVKKGKSTELMHITGGYHYHTVRAGDEAALNAIETALAAKGYIVSEK